MPCNCQAERAACGPASDRLMTPQVPLSAPQPVISPGAVQHMQRQGCCASSRPLLGIAPTDTRPPSLAPPPAHRAPPWITAAPPVHPLGPRHEVASVPAALDLVIQRGAQRVLSGEVKVGAADLIGALRLRRQIEAASQPDTGRWEQFTVALLDATRDWLGPEGFRDFIGAVRSSPAFRATVSAGPGLAYIGGTGASARPGA